MAPRPALTLGSVGEFTDNLRMGRTMHEHAWSLTMYVSSFQTPNNNATSNRS